MRTRTGQPGDTADGGQDSPPGRAPPESLAARGGCDNEPSAPSLRIGLRRVLTPHHMARWSVVRRLATLAARGRGRSAGAADLHLADLTPDDTAMCETVDSSMCGLPTLTLLSPHGRSNEWCHKMLLAVDGAGTRGERRYVQRRMQPPRANEQLCGAIAPTDARELTSFTGSCAHSRDTRLCGARSQRRV